LPALLLVISAALRLAIFNNRTEQSTHFSGLPSPANGLFWAGLAIANSFESIYKSLFTNYWGLLACIVVFSYLMLSNITMFSFKSLKPNTTVGKICLVQLVGSGVLIAVFGWASIPMTVLFYVLLSILTKKYI
jgi:CDP-diacylglycerol--serine O-phosphatidyltransferase